MAPADSVGQQLKRQRESLELSLDEVAESTKIRAWYLQALEEDNRERLPADVYALGFLRAYARHLGLDATDLVERWRGASRDEPLPEVPARPPTPARATRRPRQVAVPPPDERPPRRPKADAAPAAARGGAAPRAGGWWVVAMLLSVVLVGIVLVVLNRGTPPTAAAPHHHATASTKPSTHKKHTSPPPTHSKSSSGSGGSSTTAPSGVVLVSQTASLTTYHAHQAPVTLSLSFANPCWVEVWVNGTTSNPYGHVYQPGQSLTLTGTSSVEVRLGHPGGTTVVANGETNPAIGTNATNLLVTTGS